MAAVYRAYQPTMERFVALKVLPRHMSTSEEFTRRFRREATLVAQLQHPHILPVFDYGEAEGYPYIVMPFVVGGTLADILRKQRVTLPEARRIISQIGDALSYAHARGMIHRDIKPSNILIDERGNCLLTDFGLARMAQAGEKLTTSGQIMGTPAYMSPEQGTGSSTDHRSDLYSLGIILYEMLTGRVPYTAETPIAVVFKHVQDPLPSARKFNPSVSEALELVLLKSLAKNPDDRYQSAEAFVQAVQGAISENPAADKTLSQKIMPVITDAPEPAEAELASGQFSLEPESRQPTSPRLPTWVLVGMAVIGFTVVVAAVMMSRSNTPPLATASPTLSASLTPTDSLALASLPTSAPPTAVAQSGTSSGIEFRDDFDGQLGEGWTWLAEDPARWSLTEVPGWLQIMASDASFDGPSLPTNVLLREVPSGDFEVTTSLRFAPTSNFQFAGLIVFQDEANVLQYGRAFCDLPDTCAGSGIYFDNLENGSIAGTSPMISFDNPLIYLRLRRIGVAYTAFYSEDGETWMLLGGHVRDFTQPRIGLMAAQAEEQIPASFDYFILKSLKD